MKTNLLLFGFLLLFSCTTPKGNLFHKVNQNYPVLFQVLNNPEKYKAQIIYTELSRSKQGRVVFKNYTYGLNDESYFYPASTVKLPVAVLALEWLNEQRKEGLTMESIMLTDSVRPSQLAFHFDSTAENGMPSVAHHIKKILLVSDNEAYNKLYELLGQDYINQKVSAKGLKHTIINHRLSRPMSEEENRIFNPIRFLTAEGKLILALPERTASQTYMNSSHPSIAKSYFQSGKLIPSSMDFTYKNKFALSDFHGVIKRLIYPEQFEETERFHISESDRQFILKYMSMLPGESTYPKYDTSQYYDSYSKFFRYGMDKGKFPSQIRIFNKTGTAYGHLLDGGLFVDYEKNIAFMVSAVIYVNENETLNDDTYEYETVGFPFFKELGDFLYEIEKVKKHKRPNISGLRINYQEQ
jgi:hypothetical protein